MKKIFALMATFATLAAAVCCNPSNGPIDDEEIDDEPEVTEAITIDGQFADWAALTPGTLSSIHASLVPLKYGSARRPVFLFIISS